jgi:hypothetical protein
MAPGQERDTEGFVGRYFSVICRFKPLLGVLLVMEILFVLLGALSFPASDPGSGSRVILTVTLAVDGAVLLATAGLIYTCRTGGPYDPS